MSDIVLIQPIMGEWDSVRSNPTLPLSLLHTATLVSKEYEIKIIDQRLDKNWEKKLKKELKKNPLCVGTSAITGRPIHSALLASQIVKNESDVPVIWGGIHASLLSEQTLKNKNIDIVVREEGEVTFYELVKSLDKEKPLKGIKGIWYKERGLIKANQDRPFVDLNKLPEIPYHLINIKNYTSKFRGVPTIPIQTSRGCPNQCTYCYNVVFNKRCWRALNTENTIKRIKKVVDDFKIKSIFFTDDEFFVDLNRSKEILENILEERIDIILQIQGTCATSIKKMDKKYLKLLENSGCKELRIGAESGSIRILKLIRKGITPRQIILVNKKLKSFDISPYFDFMCGLPTEKIEDLKKTVKLALRLLRENQNARISPIHCYTPWPGTELFDLAISNGFIPPSKLEDWINYDFKTTKVFNEKKDFLESLNLVSLFVDKKSRDLVNSSLLRVFAEFYRPIARFRMEKLFLNFMIEKKIRDLYLNLKNNSKIY